MIEARMSELAARSSQAPLAITSEAWSQWWQGLSKLGLKAIQVEPASREAPAAIDGAIKELEALRRSTERRTQTLSAIKTEIAGLAKRPMPEIAALREKVIILRKQVEDSKRVASDEQARLADLRRQQAELKEKGEQLRALAVLALKHLAEYCPVCAQTYDKEATRLRLEAMAKGGIGDTQAGSGSSEKLSELLAAVAAKEKEVAAAEIALRSGEQAVSESQVVQQNISKRLSEIGIGANADDRRRAEVERAAGEADALLGRVAELQRIGEFLALRLAQSSAAAAIDELRREAETLRRDEKRSRLCSRRFTSSCTEGWGQ
jgi:DNA repair exonuclease SbcCD ATPase subunit